MNHQASLLINNNNHQISQDQQHDTSRKSESWDGRNQSFISSSKKPKYAKLQLSKSKSYLPRSISPTKEGDALRLAYEILNNNDYEFHQILSRHHHHHHHRSETVSSLIPQQDPSHNSHNIHNHNNDGNMDDSTNSSSDHSSSSTLS